MSGLNDLMDKMQRGQSQLVDQVFQPRGRIAESSKNREAGSRLDAFYAMNPNMRRGEFDPSGAKAQARGNFDAWQGDQAQRQRGYNEISQLRRGIDGRNGTVNGMPMGQNGSQGGQPQMPGYQTQQTSQPGVDPMFANVPVTAPKQYAMENGKRINPTTGLPFGYMPGDDTSAYSQNVQDASRSSVERTNQTTAQEFARRAQIAGQHNMGLSQQSAQPQMSMGPDGKMYPKAQPVMNQDARVTNSQYQEDQSYLAAPGGVPAQDNAAYARMQEYQRQTGALGIPSVAQQGLNTPAPASQQPWNIPDLGQYLLPQGQTAQAAPTGPAVNPALDGLMALLQPGLPTSPKPPAQPTAPAAPVRQPAPDASPQVHPDMSTGFNFLTPGQEWQNIKQNIGQPLQAGASNLYDLLMPIIGMMGMKGKDTLDQARRIFR